MSRPIANPGLLLLVLLGVCTAGTMALAAEAPQSGASTGSTKGVRYDHQLERSRFDPGANAHREIDGSSERMIGDRGVFMVDRVTGATLAVPNAPLAGPKPPVPAETPASTETVLPINYPRPLSENAEEHSAAVREYLFAAGISEAEVSGTHVTTTMTGGGPVKDGVQPSRSVLLWYTTHLERSLGGVPVEGSSAFAALDSDRRVISEGVYWPEIPAAVVARALAMQQMLASPKARAAFLTKVRRAQPKIGDAEGNVVILHSSAFYHSKFQVQAVYSVVVRSASGGKAQILRFDDTGAPLRMAEAVAGGTDSIKHR